MSKILAVFTALFTTAFIYIVDHPMGSIPALGRLLDPSSGWAAHAESNQYFQTEDFSIKGIRQSIIIQFEDRLVPHIQAQNEHDLYMALGYLHARFRLWQMDMQTRAAAGRIGEIVGEKIVVDDKTREKKNVILEYDRMQRRKGMVWGAENSLRAIENDPATKSVVDAYTAGINSYIASLQYKDLPLEYKLMGFEPESWTNIKSALLMKAMADDLTGYTEDFPLTLLRQTLPKEDFELLFPLRTKGSIPVIPSGTTYPQPSIPKLPTPDVAIWSKWNDVTTAINTPIQSGNNYSHEVEYPTGIGSNNWAVRGALTTSGAAILCNDPHLGLNIPSLWFEVQLQAPGINVYGVSLPGAPGVIIGFNDSIAWGLTNNYRDVKDFYEIEPIGSSSYRWDSTTRPFDTKVEIIKIKGKPDYIDKVKYTLHGPVMYDPSFEDPAHSKKLFAVTWMAHRGTNELKAIYLLNKATNYNAFTQALTHFQCPAQNIVYADRQNNIALWGQGQFVNKWKDQGRYLMKGNTSTTLWGKDIPMNENPHVLNPPQQYLVSANQMTTDSSYPYWYNGYFSDFREWCIHSFFQTIGNNRQQWFADKQLPLQWLPITTHEIPHDYNTMANMQNSNHSFLAYNIAEKLHQLGVPKEYLPLDLSWDSEAASRFQILWSLLYKNIWEDDFSGYVSTLYPKEERTLQLILSDSLLKYYDDNRTATKETLQDMVRKSLQETNDSLQRLQQQLGTTEWYKVKGTQLTHLAKIGAFSFENLKIGGWGNVINAVKKTHGPSWRMIVEMGKDGIKAHGVYPGGQSGNPGSKYYGNFVDKWASGTYYDLLFLPSIHSTTKSSNIAFTWTISPS